MITVDINAPIDWVSGHLRYGHFEGLVDLTEEEFEQFKENPEQVFEDLHLYRYCDIIVDDYSVEDYGDIEEVNYIVVGEDADV